MYPNALQFDAIPLHQMDNATFLSFAHMIDNHGQANATMQTKMGQFWTDCHHRAAAKSVEMTMAARLRKEAASRAAVCLHRAAERSAITLAVAAVVCRAPVEKDRTSWGDDFLSPASRK